MMPHFIDRRLNPKNKSLGNRQRFLKRVRGQIRQAVNNTVRNRAVADVDRQDTVVIPSRSLVEHTFRHAASGGRRARVLPGNHDYVAGDKIMKPSEGEGGAGKQGADSGDGEDDFHFVLSRSEFLDLFFEDLALPNLIKRHLKELATYSYARAGYAKAGSPSNINLYRTMKQSFGRRIALQRPRESEVTELLSEIFKLEKLSTLNAIQNKRLQELHAMLDELQRKRRVVAYIDPLDIRYNNFVPKPEPNINAVMFCLMDTSASMGEREKDLAKRFFVLLHLFLKRRYQRIDLVFIRHTHESQEVGEEEFFHSARTGGTVVSTALEEMQRIVKDRYPPSQWNIYAAQASDGDNFSSDSSRCIDMLEHMLMPFCQYFAYIEILDERETQFMADETKGRELWRSYRQVSANWQNFAMKRIAKAADIYPVFRELFAKKAENV